MKPQSGTESLQTYEKMETGEISDSNEFSDDCSNSQGVTSQREGKEVVARQIVYNSELTKELCREGFFEFWWELNKFPLKRG